MTRIKLRLLFMLFVLLTNPLSAQTERDVFITANELFASEKYVEAAPYYLRLLSLKPKNTFINYRYGACLLFNSDRKLEAMRYLKYAVNTGEEDPLALFYLARAFHYNYLFNDALNYYNEFELKAGKKQAEKLSVERLKTMCENGKLLLAKYSELIVYEKKEIEASKFFRLYDLSEIGGTLLVTEEFQSKIDIKKNHVPIIYFAQGAKEIFYSSYGDEDKGEKDIYKRVKGTDGNWSLPILIQGDVNTPYDEDYVYQSPDGKYIYFSSKGHNSMGGYDVFRCTYDEVSGVYGKVENLDFAISSPDDDFLLLVDAQDEFGYFASARQSEIGKLYVYKIGIKKVPVQLSIIAGKFESKLNKNAIVLVEIKEKASNRIIGNFQSDQAGNIVFSFPNGGQFEYTMRIVGSDQSYAQTVTIPDKNELTPLRQYILHTAVNGKEVLIIDNKFEEEVPIEEKEEIIADIFRKKASLDPNSETYDLNRYSLDEEQVLKKVGSKKKSISDLGDDLDARMQKMRTNQQRTKNHESEKLVNINSEVSEVEKMEAQIEDLANNYEELESDSEKNNILNEAELLIRQKNAKSRKIEKMIREIDDFTSINSLSSINAENAEKWQYLNGQLDNFLKEGRRSEALQLIAANADEFKKVLDSDFSDFNEKNEQKLIEFGSKIELLQDSKARLEIAVNKLSNEIFILEEKEKKAKRGKLIEIQADLLDKRQELAIGRSELKSLDNRINTISNDKEVLEEVLVSFNNGSPTSFLLPDTSQLKIEERIYKRRVGVATIAEVFFEKEIEKRDIGQQLASTEIKQGDSFFTPVQSIDEKVKEWDGKIYESDFAIDFARALNPDYANDSRILTEAAKTEPQRINTLIGLDQDLLQKAQEYQKDNLIDNSTYEKIKVFENLLKQKINDLQVTDLAKRESDSANLEKAIPGYFKNISYIKKDPSLNPQEKVQALINVDKDAIYEIQNRKAYFENIQSKNESNAFVSNKIVELNRLIEGKKAQVQLLEQNIASVNNLIVNAPLIVKERKVETLNNVEKEILRTLESEIQIVKRIGGENAANNFQNGGFRNGNTIEQNESSLLASNELLLQIKSELAKNKGLIVGDDDAIFLESKLKLLDDLYDQQIKKVQYEREKLAEQKRLAAEQIAELASQRELKSNEIIAKNQTTKELENEVEKQKWLDQNSKLVVINEKSQYERSKLLEATNNQISNIKNNTIDLRTKLKAMAYSPYFLEKTKILENKDLSEFDFFNDSKDLELRLLSGLKKMDNIGNVKPEEQEVLRTLIRESENDLNNFEISLILLPETRDRLIFRVSPKYLSNSLNLSIQKPNNDQLIRLNELDKALIVDLNSEKSRVIDLAQKNVEPARIQRKIDEISLLIDQLRSDILVREGQMRTFDRTSDVYAKEVAKNNEISQTAKIYIAQLKEINSIDELRVDVLKENRRIMTDSPDNYDTLVKLRSDLVNYKLDLDLIKRVYELDKSKDFTYSAQLVKDEMTRIDKRIKQIETNLVSKEALKTSMNNLPKQSFIAAKYNDALLQKLLDRENELKIQMQNIGRPSRSNVKIYNRVQSARIARENYLLNKQLTEMKSASRESLKRIESLKTNTYQVQKNTALASSTYRDVSKSAREWELKADKTKNVRTKNFYLQQANVQRKNLEILLEKTYVENKIQDVSNGAISTLNSFDEIEFLIRNLEIEKNRIRAEINNNKLSLQLVNRRKDKAVLFQQQELLLGQLKNVETELASYESQLSNQPKNLVSAIEQTAQTTPLTFQEERGISGSTQYKNLSRLGFDLMELETQIGERKRAIQEKKTAVRLLLQDKESAENEKKLNEYVQTLLKSEKELAFLIQEHEVKSAKFKALLDTNDGIALKMQNMILRGIDPLVPLIKKSDFVPVPTQSFEISSKNVTENSIPLEVKYPSGLIFRVQLGAYDRPLEGSLFKEYKPVDGTKASNGLYLYRTGFFKNYNQAKDAEGKVRSRSASDAFVVAFCNGERITIQEARRLEKTGGCEPEFEEDQIIKNKVSPATVESENGSKSTTIRNSDLSENKNSDINNPVYNQSKNAVLASTIESIKGLFFTIQVGVFNRPADASLLPGISDDVLTERLENGQIRYATGIYSSISLAQEKKIEIINSGIKDAFITAYFDSQRITLAEAKKMIEAQGNEVFTKKSETEVKGNTDEIIEKVTLEDEYVKREEKVKDYNFYSKTNKLIDPNQPVVSSTKQPNRVQLISKNNYEDFPRDALNRFNSHAPFYFDANDKKIKSPVYKSLDQIPQVYLLKKEIDTVYFYVDEIAERLESKNNRIITFDLEGEKINGDIANYLIRLNYRKEYFKKPNALQIDIKDIPTENGQKIIDELQVLGVRPKMIIGY